MFVIENYFLLLIVYSRKVLCNLWNFLNKINIAWTRYEDAKIEYNNVHGMHMRRTVFFSSVVAVNFKIDMILIALVTFIIFFFFRL